MIELVGDTGFEETESLYGDSHIVIVASEIFTRSLRIPSSFSLRILQQSVLKLCTHL